MKRIRIRVPATSANLGPGFDVLGIALKLYNEIEVSAGGTATQNSRLKVSIDIEGEGKDLLPRGEDNIVWQTMKQVFAAEKKASGKKLPFDTVHIRLVNGIPLSSGLGSSAAARLGGILGAYALLGKKPSLKETAALGCSLEGHPDNIVPAILGGLCVSAFINNEVQYVKLACPGLKATVCTPNFGLATEQSRKILPRTVPFATAVFNASRVALLLSAFSTRQYGLLGAAMEDKLHQPYREPLIPGMKKVVEAAMRSGAYGTALSGAGPSLLAFGSPAKAKKIGQNMKDTWQKFNISSRYFVLDFDTQGARFL